MKCKIRYNYKTMIYGKAKKLLSQFFLTLCYLSRARLPGVLTQGEYCVFKKS